ncbi:MAG: SEC59/DGK1/VTE5 family protein [Phycisphaerae bacterium]|jgi:dolichol kinase
MTFRHELLRKTIHAGSAVCPLIYGLLGKEGSLWIAIPITIAFIIIDVLRRQSGPVQRLYGRLFGAVTRRHEARHFCGATYVMIAVVLCIVLFPRPVAIASMLFLSISDAVASLVGLTIGRPRWSDKSAAGSAAFLVTAVLIALLCLPDAKALGVIGAIAATVVEALPIRVGPLRLDDNLTVPLAGGVVMTLLLQA